MSGNIRCIEALSLYEGKSTIFCGSSVALAPKFPDIQAGRPLELFETICQCSFGQRYFLAELTVNRYRPASALRGKKYHILRKQRRTGAKVPGRSGRQKRPGDVRRSLLHNMRRRGLSTTGPDGNPAKREGFSLPILASRMRPSSSKKFTFCCFIQPFFPLL
jgi:hypothetical protein